MILTEDRYLKPDPADWYQAQIQTEDGLLAQACANRGLSVSGPVGPTRPSVGKLAVRCSGAPGTASRGSMNSGPGSSAWRRTRLYNPAALIRWNLDKRYLAGARRSRNSRGANSLRGRRRDPQPGGYHGRGGLARGGLLPVVSGAARLTYRVSLATWPCMRPFSRAVSPPRR